MFRNDLAGRDSSAATRQLFSGIPVFSRVQLAKLQECRQKPLNLRSFLSDLGYRTPYNPSAVRGILLEALNDDGSNIATFLAALSFQLLSRIFVSTDLMDREAFGLFLQGITFSVDESQGFDDFILHFLLKSARKIDSFSWGKGAIEAGRNAFEWKLRLGEEFTDSLIDVSHIRAQSAEGPEQTLFSLGHTSRIRSAALN
jgi:hypothetical protein